MSPEDIDSLEQLAREAAPGPWTSNGPDVDMPRADDYPRRCAIVFRLQLHVEQADVEQADVDTARYLAACSPERILSLCARAKHADAVLRRLASLDLAHRDERMDAQALLSPWEAP